MATPIHGKNFAKLICSALGIDPSTCGGIDISIRPIDVVTVTVTGFVDAGAGDEVVELLSCYRLVALDAPEGE